MGKYIALLRGINVGGNNKIAMIELKAAFEKYGFQGVKTYINSGNVIFESECKDEDVLREQCETLISNIFKLSISVVVISAETLSEALIHAPEWWDADGDSKHNAIFIIPPATAESVVEEVGETKPEYEKVSYYGSIIFWSAPLKTFSRTRWSKIVGTSMYNAITIRNANTAKKLLELMK